MGTTSTGDRSTAADPQAAASDERPVAVVPVRAGVLAPGGEEAILEAGSRVILVGDGIDEAVSSLHLHGVDEVDALELGAFAPGVWASALAPHLRSSSVVLLPASSDGRDVAPRLAAILGRPHVAGAVEVRVGETPPTAAVARHGGLVRHDVVPHGPFVATLQPGVRGVEHAPAGVPPTVRRLAAPSDAAASDAGHEPRLLELLPPDAATMDLAEAPRIVGGGAGLMGEASAATFAQLTEVGAAMGASMGATRVVTDAGWVPHTRQIGTTGVVVDPRLYLAFGISGAVQHTAGLGHPEHVISVNVDSHCPMMAMADLAVVADAVGTLAALAERLGVRASGTADAEPGAGPGARDVA